MLPQSEYPVQFFESFEQRYMLTKRESEILHLIAEGRNTAEIAGDLFISENTVKFHIKNLYRKTGSTSRSDVIARFKENAAP